VLTAEKTFTYQGLKVKEGLQGASRYSATGVVLEGLSDHIVGIKEKLLRLIN
jgi:hypothetical protein